MKSSTGASEARRNRGEEEKEMAETAVSFVVDHLVPLLVQEAKFLGGVRQGVAEIKDELEGMKAFLKDAADRQDSDEGIKVWVKQVRDIAYDTEDVVDEFLLRMGRHYGPGFQGFLRRCGRFIKQLRARHRLATQIRDIKTRVQALKDRRAAFSLMKATDEGTSSSSSTTGERLAALFTDESELVGIDKSRDELMRRVLEGGSRLTVIPVVGMGGLGKTTLVSKTYEAVSKTAFDCCAWITVSQAFRTEELFRSVIRQLYQAVEKPPPEGIDAMDDAQLVGTLRAYLQGKRYVVVLDDVWSENAWKVIALALPVNECGSRVMVTTRSHDVASFSCTQNLGDDDVYRMPTLASEEAWKLFCKKAFRSNTCPAELEATSRSIVGKCGGLPLAILAIGGLLYRRNKTPLEWDRVYRSLSTAGAMESSTDEALRNMRKILWLSYDALPYHLRSCFLYFGMFPEDHNVKRSKLTRQWVAEGFISWNAAMMTPPPEAIAEDRLNELVDRNLVQVVKLDCYGRVEKCRIHDLLRDLVLSKAREENFCTSLAQEVDNVGLDDKPPRRLSTYKVAHFLESTDDHLSHLRTLSMFGVGEEAPLLSRFRLLRVLTLKGAHLETFPCEITDLLHLSYLSMRGTSIKVLPDSIGKLVNLQTLDLKYTPVSELPRAVLKLQKLRHLLIHHMDGYIVHGVRMPTGMGGLRHLQKLLALEVNGNKEQLEELGSLKQLTTLGVTAVREGDGEALCGYIKKMHHLQSLTIVSVEGNERLNVQSLSTTVLPLLRSINLWGRLEKLPEMIVSWQKLVKIVLCGSGLRDDPLRALQSLPKLVELLISEAYDGQALRCEAGGFPRLGLLVIRNLGGLSSITFERGSMPNLLELRVEHLTTLREVPFGIEHLTTLRELYVSSMPQEFVDSIQKNEGKDWVKVKHIPIINCGRWRGGGWVVESLSK